MAKSFDYTIKTDDKCNQHILKWHFNQFANLLATSNIKVFCTPTSENPSKIFQLKMLLFGRNNARIELYYLSHIDVIVDVHFYIYQSSTSTPESRYNKLQANKWQYLHTWQKENLPYYSKEGNLALTCFFTVPHSVNKQSINTSKIKLSNDFEKLLNNELFSDVIIMSSEGRQYNVHKVVLASRSEVLKAHFEHDTTECHTNVVESPLESEVLQQVLTYFYSGKAPLVNEMPEKLIVAANFYQLSELKNLCELALYKKLTPENAIETLELADLHSAHTLQQMTIEFIISEAMSVLKTDSWANLKSAELTKRIVECILNIE